MVRAHCVQSEYGDIYKVTLETRQETVTAVKVKYFDTLPPCSALCVLKTGFLFAASEYGNHALYQFIVSHLDPGSWNTGDSGTCTYTPSLVYRLGSGACGKEVTACSAATNRIRKGFVCLYGCHARGLDW